MSEGASETCGSTSATATDHVHMDEVNAGKDSGLGPLTAEEVAACLRVLKTLAANEKLYASRPFKAIRVALTPFLEVVPPVGNEPHCAIPTHNSAPFTIPPHTLQSSAWVRCIIYLEFATTMPLYPMASVCLHGLLHPRRFPRATFCMVEMMAIWYWSSGRRGKPWTQRLWSANERRLTERHVCEQLEKAKRFSGGGADEHQAKRVSSPSFFFFVSCRRIL